MKLIIFLSLVGLLQAANQQVSVCYNDIYPTSNYINAGDTITFYCNDPTEVHWLVTVLANFSGQNFSGQINSGQPTGPGVFSYTVHLVEDGTGDNGFPWADLANPDTSGFGIAYIARTTDVQIQWTVFKTHPPALSNYALDDKYPYNIQVQKGQRVVWNSTVESHLNHITLFTNRQFQASIGCPFVHPWVSNRNFGYFAYTFTSVGTYNYICGVHTSMRGSIQVCNGRCGALSRIVQVCGTNTHNGDDDDDQ